MPKESLQRDDMVYIARSTGISTDADGPQCMDDLNADERAEYLAWHIETERYELDRMKMSMRDKL